MRQNDRLRTSVRLLIQKGQVLLRYAGVPSVACTLLDLSEGGCRCAGQFGSLEHQIAQAWERVLEPGRPVQIEMSFLPYLNRFPMEAEIRVARPIQGGGVEVGLKFRNVSPQTAATLNQIMLAVATGKVREAFAPEQAAQAAQYLVGARGDSVQIPPGIAAPPQEPPPPVPAPPVPPPPAPPPAPPLTILPSSAPTPPPGSSSPPLAMDGPSSAAPAQKAGDDQAAVEGWTWKSYWENPFRGKRVGEVLVQMGKLQAAQIEESVQNARAVKLQLGRYLLREGLVTPEELCRALALQSGLPMTDLSAVDTVAPLGGIFPFPELVKHEFVPIDDSRSIVCVAAANPLSKAVVGELEAMCRKKVEVFLAQEDLVLRALDRLRPDERDHDRRYNRYFVSLPVSYQFCNRLGRLAEMVSYTGRTVDISEGGLQIEGPVANVGQPEDIRRRGLCLRLVIVAAPHEVQALCDPRFIKVREKPGPNEYPWSLGLRILEMTAEDRRKLKEICIAVGRQQSGPTPA